MASTSGPRRALWAALGGFGLGVAGAWWDTRWHDRNDGTFAGSREVLEAHWLIFVGVAISFASMVVAVRGLGSVRRSARVAVGIGLAGASVDLTGFVWDNLRHLSGEESSVAHLMSAVGAPTLFVAALAALVLTRHGGSRPERPAGLPVGGSERAR